VPGPGADSSADRRRAPPQVLRHALEGLRDVHAAGRVHQSLGPGSVVLSTVQERDAATMRARVRDLAFSLDVSPDALAAALEVDPMDAPASRRALNVIS
jgi:hypothetical protein